MHHPFPDLAGNIIRRKAKNVQEGTGVKTKKQIKQGKKRKNAAEFYFDFTIASVHNLRGMDDFYYIDFNEVSVDEILKLYFAELAETAGFEHFDTLAHLTYPLRYILDQTGKIPDLTPT